MSWTSFFSHCFFGTSLLLSSSLSHCFTHRLNHRLTEANETSVLCNQAKLTLRRCSQDMWWRISQTITPSDRVSQTVQALRRAQEFKPSMSFCSTADSSQSITHLRISDAGSSALHRLFIPMQCIDSAPYATNITSTPTNDHGVRRSD